MYIRNISDYQRFFETLDTCDASVTLVMPDGSKYDWQQNKSLLLSVAGLIDTNRFGTLELLPESAADTFHILCYLMENA